MKKSLLAAAVALFLSACGTDSAGPDHAQPAPLEDPTIVQPESAAIPQDMEIRKDSVIVSDSQAGTNYNTTTENRRETGTGTGSSTR